MGLQQITAFFKWCTVINGAILIAAVIGIALVPEIAYRVHGRMFEIPPENIGTALYLLVGMFKVMWLVFNVTPFATLLILQNRRAGATAATPA